MSDFQMFTGAPMSFAKDPRAGEALRRESENAALYRKSERSWNAEHTEARAVRVLSGKPASQNPRREAAPMRAMKPRMLGN